MTTTRSDLHAAGGACADPAGAAEFNYKLAHAHATDHHVRLRLVEAVGKIQQES